MGLNPQFSSRKQNNALKLEIMGQPCVSGWLTLCFQQSCIQDMHCLFCMFGPLSETAWVAGVGNRSSKKMDWTMLPPVFLSIPLIIPLERPAITDVFCYSVSLETLNASGQNLFWRCFNINYNVNKLNQDFWTVLLVDILGWRLGKGVLGRGSQGRCV